MLPSGEFPVGHPYRGLFDAAALSTETRMLRVSAQGATLWIDGEPVALRRLGRAALVQVIQDGVVARTEYLWTDGLIAAYTAPLAPPRTHQPAPAPDPPDPVPVEKHEAAARRGVLSAGLGVGRSTFVQNVTDDTPEFPKGNADTITTALVVGAEAQTVGGVALQANLRARRWVDPVSGHPLGLPDAGLMIGFGKPVIGRLSARGWAGGRVSRQFNWIATPDDIDVATFAVTSASLGGELSWNGALSVDLGAHVVLGWPHIQGFEMRVRARRSLGERWLLGVELAHEQRTRDVFIDGELAGVREDDWSAPFVQIGLRL
jgi:hypothetical protein